MATPRTKLFVGHLPDGCTNDELMTLFEKYGNVKECDVINKYGFVHMASTEEAEDAIKALNNYNFRGSSLSVERSKSKLHPEPGAPGRAKGERFSPRSSRGGGGGYGGGRGGYRGGYSNGYNRYDGPPYGGSRGSGGDYYQDRYGGGSMGASRMRPYPSPYDRPSMGPPRDDPYAYRPSPYSMPSRGDPYARPSDPYARPSDPYARPSAMPPRDLYERRAPTAYPSTNEYLYSRRSPPPQAPAPDRSYWYGDSYGDSASAARRPYF